MIEDPNDEILLSTSRAALKRMVEDAWHDSAVQTADRLLTAITARNALLRQSMLGDHVHEGTWPHVFTENGREIERECTLVLSSEARKVIALTIVRDQKERDGTAAEMADVEEGLSTNDVWGDPEGWDFVMIDDLPAWAADQIVDRREGRL